MGGKTLRFPKRKKFVPGDDKPAQEKKEEPISEEEHKKRIELLKSLGIVKSVSENAEEESKA
jgi:glycerol-3-phosphate cytidylyltransferase-like family protein